ncbi:MAG: hypothetical protein LBL66_07705 [Clostridiales bacterium]|jgi:alpha-mannosidase|nr:hypothetical protein [Clostridiales bacterium]
MPMKRGEKAGKLHLIGNAHIDPVWLWTWREGMAEARSTFKAALERIGERDNFVFTASSARFYKWLEETDPEAFEAVRRQAAAGRWSIVGGWWVQADCNLPCGEALARQGLYGQRYFLSRFGIAARIGYNVDSFGHCAQLPQILKKCGMGNYVFSRPAAHEKALPEAFVWRAPDGSAVNAYRIPHGYESNTVGDLEAKLEKYRADGNGGARMLFYGAGNHGGGPTREMLNRLDGVVRAGNAEYSSPDRFFAERASPANAGDMLPEIAGELQRHAVGCYSAHSEIKKQNRKTEAALLAAEKWSAAAERAAGRPYGADELAGAWERLLFNQFHDALGGCSIPSVCGELLRAYGAARDAAERESVFAVQRIAAGLDTAKGLPPWEAKAKLGTPVAVFNPLSFEAERDVRIRRLCGGGRRYRAVSPSGESCPVQETEGEHLFPDSKDGLFRAKVPPLGYALYYVRELSARAGNTAGRGGTDGSPADSAAGAGGVRAYREPDGIPARSLTPVYGDTVMANGRLTARIDGRTFLVKGVYDGELKRELLGGTLRAVVLDDGGNDTWAHDVSDGAHVKNNRLGVWSSCNEFLGSDIGAFEGVSAEITECGELRCVVRCVSVYGGSKLVQDYALYAGGDALRVSATLDWREKHKTAKIAFPSAVPVSVLTCEAPYGYAARPCDGRENVGHRWACVHGGDGGLCVVNDSKYSFSASGGELRIAAARSALYADHGGIRGGERPFLDWGAQTFSYAVSGFSGAPDFARAAKTAEAFNAPFETVFEGYHAGERGDTESFLYVSAENVLVSAVKRAEDGNGHIVRAYETAGKATPCEIRFFGAAAALAFAPHEIKTVRFADEKAAETDMLES